MTTDLACSIRHTLHVLSHIPLKMLQPPNPPNPETQISRCKFKWARGSEAHRAEAAARHQGRSQRIRKNFRGFIQLQVAGVYASVDSWVIPLIENPPDFFPRALGPSLMARGSCGEGKPLRRRLPNQNLNLNLYCERPRNLSFSIWWILGVRMCVCMCVCVFCVCFVCVCV